VTSILLISHSNVLGNKSTALARPDIPWSTLFSSLHFVSLVTVILFLYTSDAGNTASIMTINFRIRFDNHREDNLCSWGSFYNLHRIFLTLSTSTDTVAGEGLESIFSRLSQNLAAVRELID